MNSIFALWDVAIAFALGLVAARYLGIYMAHVFMGRPTFLDSLFGPVERFFYRLIGTSPRHQMGWKEYFVSLMLLSIAAIVFVWALLMEQGNLPYNGLGAPNMTWDLAFHTTSAFVTNTDYQHYAGEYQVSLLGQLFGLQTDFFLSAATGLAVLAAMIRGFTRKDGTIGNFWVDFMLSVTRVLLPISIVAAVVLMLAGVPQTLEQTASVPTLGGGHQAVPVGPLASWDSIELLGTNGGGYFAVNLANPLQNPNAFTNDFAIVLMMLMGFSAPFMFAEMVRRPKEMQPLLAAILVIFLAAVALFFVFEIANPALSGLNLTQNAGYTVGTESRFTLGENSLFQVTSIYDNVGAVSVQLAALTPGAQMVLLWGMFLQCAPGGVGTGFATLLINVILAIFVGGLMVGRSPEYIGNKIEGGSVKWAVVTFLAHPFAILVPLAVFSSMGWVQAFSGHGPQAFTQVLYEFTSESANNGSGMGYPGAPGDANVYFNVAGGLIMLFGRFFPILAMLAIGGALARAPVLPTGPGTLKTQSATFTFYLIVFILVVTGLIFLPVLALGPFSSGVTLP